MRILELHCDYISVLPKKKALKSVAELSNAEQQGVRMENVLVVFSSFEQGDDEATLDKAVAEVKKNFDEVKAASILIYPYAHLSSSLAKPAAAQNLLDAFLARVKTFAPDAQKSPFGYYKQFELKCKGHPLAELSKTISTGALEQAAVKLGATDADVTAGPSPLLGYAAATQKTLKAEKTPEAQRNTAVLMLAHALEKTGAKATVAFSKDAEAYLDFQGKPVNAETLKTLQADMEKIQKAGLTVTSKAVKPNHAFSNDFLKEAARESGEKQVLVAELQGREYLVPGPLCPSTKDVAAFELTKFGGSYWKNNAQNARLQRIHVQAFATETDRKAFLELLKKAEARDHRKIGKQMDLFSIHEEGTGFIFWHPPGMTLFKELEKLLREEYEQRDYMEIRTPIILNEDLWHRSGHWDHYKENMYFTQIDGVPHAVKPMNCPGAILVYKTRPRSYRDLPLRLAENGMDHRHELSGVLSGLFRVRAFTMDDAHLFVTQDQILSEVTNFTDFLDSVYAAFGFTYEVELSTKPEKAMGSGEFWEKAETALKKALEQNGKKFKINQGDGAFYGPKIDFKIRDALGRKWQCGTVQLDLQMPEKFDLHYEGPDGKRHRPVILHRVIYGSFERFIGILIEHFAGAFPTWLAPEQVRVLPLTDNENDYAKEVRGELKQHGLRVTADTSSGKLEGKIRDAQLAKVPYMLVVGQKEREAGTVSVRKRDGKVTHGVKREAFLKKVQDEIRTRKAYG